MMKYTVWLGGPPTRAHSTHLVHAHEFFFSILGIHRATHTIQVKLEVAY